MTQEIYEKEGKRVIFCYSKAADKLGYVDEMRDAYLKTNNATDFELVEVIKGEDGKRAWCHE